MDAKTLKLTAEKNRKRLLEVIYNAGAGHTGGDLSCLNLLTVLYFHKLSLDLSNLKNPEPLLYAVRCLVKLNRREDAIAGLQALLTFGGDDKDPAQAACLKQAEALLEMLKGAQK